MVREKIGAPGEVQPGILNPAQDMIARTANVHDTAGIYWALLAAAQREMLIVAQFLQLKHERFTHRRAACHRAMTRPTSNYSARRARVDELLWHINVA
jgi:hypothetical protein